MKIRALRLAEVGPFSSPVAIEGFSGRLDVLTGPNELGKSTLFTALAILLSEKHTSAARPVAALRADTGGTPLIEADLELDGRLYRLRKRFLAQRSADLVDLAAGRAWRGADAENEIERLLGGPQMRSMRGLVWVEQGASFSLPEKADSGLAPALAALIEHEVADTTGSSEARRLAAEARARLEALVTAKTGKPRAGGDLHNALRARDALREELTLAAQRLAAAEERCARLDTVRCDHAALSNPVVREALAARATATAKALEDAERARERLKAMEERVNARRLEDESARRAETAFQQALDDASRSSAEIVKVETEIEAATAELSRLQHRRDEAVAGHARATAAATSARNEAARAQALELRRAAQRAIEDIDRRLAAIGEARREIELAGAALPPPAVTEPAVEEASALEQSLELISARIEAAAPRATIAYLPGAAGRIAVDGRPLAGGETLAIEQATEMRIDGIGTLTIEPGGSAAGALLTSRDHARTALAAQLARMGVDSLPAARSALSARREALARIAAAEQRISDLAPSGVAAIEKARELEAARLAAFSAAHPGVNAGPARASVPDEALDVAALRADLDRAEADLAEASRARDAIEEEARTCQTRLSILAGRLETARSRLLEIEAGLPPAAERNPEMGRLSAALEAAAAALGEAVRDRADLLAATPDRSAFEALAGEARAAAAALAEHDRRRHAQEREIAELEGAMRRDGEDGIALEVARLEEALAAAEARASDIELDAAALDLLATRLERSGDAHRNALMRPLVDRIAPLLAALFPGASLSIDGPLVVAGLNRPPPSRAQAAGTARSDALQRLSGGTREQIATIVRLAYGHLLADRGTPLPLVLDDALVYSDDARLETMVDLLGAAAARHQVVLLSCHERALAPLLAHNHATRLELTAWTAAGMEGMETRKGRARAPASDAAA